MNRRTWAAMTDEERRIKVAELCEIEVVSDGITHHLMPCNLDARAYVKNGKYLCTVPDYLNDLNATHLAESQMFGDETMISRWLSNLILICGSVTAALRATAAQRAEAIALTLEPE